ncbi:MAG TPA: TlpA disulfide reductase family protein [Vicinamibacterales bacterium]|nr:TlpA disulfide reductase family protein [Vicinamibacterales bacterium]
MTFIARAAVVAMVLQSGAAAALPKIGAAAPAYAFAEVLNRSESSAKALTPESLRGKVVVLDFFATWCAPCVASVPQTNALADELSDQPIVFLAVANEDRPTLEAFLKKTPMRAWLVLDAEGQTYRNYMISGLPFVVVIGKDGRVAEFTHPSRLNRASLEKLAKAPSLSGTRTILSAIE